MKITKLKSITVNPGSAVPVGTGYGQTGYGQNWIFVKIYTDEGIEGLGEAFSTGKDKAIEASLLEYEPWLVGKDPTRIIHNWQAIYRSARYPLGTASMAALSAVEQAMWDIAGKQSGLPVYKMLGGPSRDRIRLYASSYFFFGLSDKALVERAKELVEEGFNALKLNALPDDYSSKSDYRLLMESVERIRAVREAVGDEIDIGLDYHGRSLSPSDAIQLASLLVPYRPLFIEEPALTETPESLAEVKSKTTIPIAGGERCISRDRFRELIEKRAVHIFQPEPTVNGGILETVKQAALAELYHIMVAPHQSCSPVSLMVCAHINACISNFLIQEYNIQLDAPCVRDLFAPLPEIAGGYLKLPSEPGLGIELNEEAATEYPCKPFAREVIITRDGSVGLE